MRGHYTAVALVFAVGTVYTALRLVHHASVGNAAALVLAAAIFISSLVWAIRP